MFGSNMGQPKGVGTVGTTFAETCVGLLDHASAFRLSAVFSWHKSCRNLLFAQVEPILHIVSIAAESFLVRMSEIGNMPRQMHPSQ